MGPKPLPPMGFSGFNMAMKPNTKIVAVLLTATLAAAISPRRARAEGEELSGDPKFYRQYFNLEKGDTFIRKVKHLGERIMDRDDAQKKDKSILGIRQALNDLYTSIDRQNGQVDAGQSSMLNEVLPAEAALTITHKELREVAEAFEEAWELVQSAKKKADAINRKHHKNVGIQMAAVIEADRIAEEIRPGSASERPQEASGDQGKASELDFIQPQDQEIGEALQELEVADQVVTIVGERLSQAKDTIERVLPFAEEAGKVHEGAQKSLRGRGAKNASKEILSDATITARKAIELAPKVFAIMQKVQRETYAKLIIAAQTEAAISAAQPLTKEAINGTLEEDRKVVQAGSEWDEAGDDEAGKAQKAAAAAKAAVAKGEAAQKAEPPKGPVMQAKALAAKAKASQGCNCGQKSATNALGKGAKKLAKISDHKPRYQPTTQRATFASGDGAEKTLEKKDRFRMPRIDPNILNHL